MADMPIDNPLFLILGDGEDVPEQDFEVTVEQLRDTGEKVARITLRLPPRLYTYIDALATSNGRSWAAECQAALQAHEALSRLSAIRDTELQTHRKQLSGGVHGVTGDSAARFGELLRDDIAQIWTAAFGTRTHNREFARTLFGE
jgi:hypothetical protein